MRYSNRSAFTYLAYPNDLIEIETDLIPAKQYTCEEKDEHKDQGVEEVESGILGVQSGLILLESAQSEIRAGQKLTMNQCMFKNGVDSSQRRKDGPKPAKKGLCPDQLDTTWID